MLKNNKIVMAYVKDIIEHCKVQVDKPIEVPLAQRYELSWDSVPPGRKLKLAGLIMRANDFEVDLFDEDFAKEISFSFTQNNSCVPQYIVETKLLTYYDKIMRELIYSEIDPMYQKDKEGITIYV